MKKIKYALYEFDFGRNSYVVDTETGKFQEFWTWQTSNIRREWAYHKPVPTPPKGYRSPQSQRRQHWLK